MCFFISSGISCLSHVLSVPTGHRLQECAPLSIPLSLQNRIKRAGRLSRVLVFGKFPSHGPVLVGTGSQARAKRDRFWASKWQNLGPSAGLTPSKWTNGPAIAISPHYVAGKSGFNHGPHRQKPVVCLFDLLRPEDA